MKAHPPFLMSLYNAHKVRVHDAAAVVGKNEPDTMLSIDDIQHYQTRSNDHGTS